MRVVLDTNMYYGSGAFFREPLNTLIKARAQTGHDLVIPQIVYDELLGIAGESIDKAKIAVENARRDLGKVLPKEIADKVVIEDNELANDYKQMLEEKITEAQGVMGPYPNVSHEVVAKRAISRRRPFSRDGSKGYRDSLIWETILDLLRTDPLTPIALISNDKSAFASDSDESILHPHLVEDVVELVSNSEMVRYYDSIEAFNADQLYPRLKFLDDTTARLSSGTFAPLVLSDFLLDYLGEERHALSVRPDSIGVRDNLVSPHISSISRVSSVSGVSARFLTEETMIVEFTTAVSAKISIVVGTDAFQQLPEHILSTFVPQTANEIVTTITIESDFSLSLRLTFSNPLNEVIAVELVDLAPIDPTYVSAVNALRQEQGVLRQSAGRINRNSTQLLLELWVRQMVEERESYETKMKKLLSTYYDRASLKSATSISDLLDSYLGLSASDENQRKKAGYESHLSEAGQRTEWGAHKDDQDGQDVDSEKGDISP